jgi:hypothetical protein
LSLSAEAAPQQPQKEVNTKEPRVAAKMAHRALAAKLTFEHVEQANDVLVMMRVQLLQEHDLAKRALRVGAVLKRVENLLQSCTGAERRTGEALAESELTGASRAAPLTDCLARGHIDSFPHDAVRLPQARRTAMISTT